VFLRGVMLLLDEWCSLIIPDGGLSTCGRLGVLVIVAIILRIDVMNRGVFDDSLRMYV